MEAQRNLNTKARLIGSILIAIYALAICWLAVCNLIGAGIGTATQIGILLMSVLGIGCGLAIWKRIRWIKGPITLLAALQIILGIWLSVNQLGQGAKGMKLALFSFLLLSLFLIAFSLYILYAIVVAKRMNANEAP